MQTDLKSLRVLNVAPMLGHTRIGWRVLKTFSVLANVNMNGIADQTIVDGVAGHPLIVGHIGIERDIKRCGSTVIGVPSLAKRIRN